MSLSSARFVASSSQRKRSVAEIALVSIALLAVATRIGEIPDHPLAFVRVVLSIAAVAFLLFGPGISLGRRAALVIAVEAGIGFATFALVDVPFVIDHQRQIGMLAVSIAERVERAERAERLAR